MNGRSELVDTLGRLTLFADFTRPELEAVAHTVDEEMFAEGQRVLRQGLSGSGFFVILEGKATISIDGEARWTLGAGRLLRRDLRPDRRAADRRRRRDEAPALRGRAGPGVRAVPARAPAVPLPPAPGRGATGCATRSHGGSRRPAVPARRLRRRRRRQRPGRAPDELRACARSAIRHAVLSADDAPGGMFRRFPVFERLITWTKPDAPFERGTREYEWFDHNSLLAEEPECRALVPAVDGPHVRRPVARGDGGGSRRLRGAGPAARSATAAAGSRRGARTTASCSSPPTASTGAARPCSRSASPSRGRRPIPGVERPRTTSTRGDPERYQGRSVFIIGKRNSGFEVASGLLAWARADRACLAEAGRHRRRSAARRFARATSQPLDEYARGGAERLRRRRDDRAHRAAATAASASSRTGRRGPGSSSSRWTT